MADRAIVIDAFDRLSLKAEKLRHLTEAMAELATAGGEPATVVRLVYLAEDLAAEVCSLIGKVAHG